MVPEKEEPHGFIKLAAEIFELLDRQLLCSKNRSIKDYLKRNLSDQEIVILTSILKDLDKELSRPDSSAWSVNIPLVDLFMVFSEQLSRFAISSRKGQHFYSARYLTWIRRLECCPLYKYAKSRETLEFKDTFINLEHIKSSFPDHQVVANDNSAKLVRPFRLTFEEDEGSRKKKTS